MSAPNDDALRDLIARWRRRKAGWTGSETSKVYFTAFDHAADELEAALGWATVVPHADAEERS